MKVYWQSMLKRAFSGELKRAWRVRKTLLPTNAELLAEIRAARKAWYEGQMAAYGEAYRAWAAREGEKEAAEGAEVQEGAGADGGGEGGVGGFVGKVVLGADTRPSCG